MKYTKKLWIGPTIMLTLFLLSIFAMNFSEAKLTNLFTEHSVLLQKNTRRNSRRTTTTTKRICI